MDDACVTSKEELPPPTGKGPTRPCVVIPHNGSVPHALFYDLTHDNESYLDKRSAEDALSTGALMTFSYSAIGSVKGFDDLYPKLLNLVQEKRKYEATRLSEDSGIARVKRILNSLHAEMAIGKFEEGHVHEENGVSSAIICPCEIQYLLFSSTLSCIVCSPPLRRGICLSHTPRSKRGPKIGVSVSYAKCVIADSL